MERTRWPGSDRLTLDEPVEQRALLGVEPDELHTDSHEAEPARGLVADHARQLRGEGARRHARVEAEDDGDVAVLGRPRRPEELESGARPRDVEDAALRPARLPGRCSPRLADRLGG